MSDQSPLGVEEIIALCQKLSPEDRQLVRRGLASSPPTPPSSNWMTLDEVAADLGKSKSQISRDAKQGKFLTNGEIGRYLRIHGLSVARMYYMLRFNTAKRFRSRREVRRISDPLFQDWLNAMIDGLQALISGLEFFIRNGITANGDIMAGGLAGEYFSSLCESEEIWRKGDKRFRKWLKDKYGFE
jgi:hypothetical protein